MGETPMLKGLNPGGERVGCITGILTILLLVFVVFPYEMVQRVREQAKTAITARSVQRIDVVILEESNERVAHDLLNACSAGDTLAEFTGVRICTAKVEKELPDNYPVPSYLLVQDDGYTRVAYQITTLEGAQHWLAENGYSDADFTFGAVSSTELGTYCHRKSLGENYYDRSEIRLLAYSEDGGYYICDYIAEPTEGDLEGYHAFMKVRQ